MTFLKKFFINATENVCKYIFVGCLCSLVISQSFLYTVFSVYVNSYSFSNEMINNGHIQRLLGHLKLLKISHMLNLYCHTHLANKTTICIQTKPTFILICLFKQEAKRKRKLHVTHMCTLTYVYFFCKTISLIILLPCLVYCSIVYQHQLFHQTKNCSLIYCVCFQIHQFQNNTYRRKLIQILLIVVLILPCKHIKVSLIVQCAKFMVYQTIRVQFWC